MRSTTWDRKSSVSRTRSTTWNKSFRNLELNLMEPSSRLIIRISKLLDLKIRFVNLRMSLDVRVMSSLLLWMKIRDYWTTLNSWMVKAEVLIRGLRIYKTKMMPLRTKTPDSKHISPLPSPKSNNTNPLLKDSPMLMPNSKTRTINSETKSLTSKTISRLFRMKTTIFLIKLLLFKVRSMTWIRSWLIRRDSMVNKVILLMNWEMRLLVFRGLFILLRIRLLNWIESFMRKLMKIN